MKSVTPTRGWAALDRLTPEVRERLLPLGRHVDPGPGEQVFTEGDPTPFLGVVEDGRVALRYRVPEIGRRVTIATVEPGELFGWSAVVAPFRATADAVATEPVRILAFDAAALRERLQVDPELAAQLLPLVLESVSRRLTVSWHQLLDLFAPRGLGPW